MQSAGGVAAEVIFERVKTDAVGLENPRIGKAVHRVPGKPGEVVDDHLVKRRVGAGGIRHHSLEVCAACGAARDALVDVFTDDYAVVGLVGLDELKQMVPLPSYRQVLFVC